MGRGRAKAKQTKVARELKYQSPNTDLAALQRELSGNKPGGRSDSNLDEYDEYNEYEYDDEDVDDASDQGDWAARRS